MNSNISEENAVDFINTEEPKKRGRPKGTKGIPRGRDKIPKKILIYCTCCTKTFDLLKDTNQVGQVCPHIINEGMKR